MKADGTDKNKIAFILGAGFSKCAEVPIQAEISPLLSSPEFNSPIDKSITAIIEDFFHSSFGWRSGSGFPSLEDVFTFIDLSVSKGHSLGRKYNAERLNAIRRFLIYRIFQVLDVKFKMCPEILKLLTHYKDYETSFIVLNWDIVLENHLLEIYPHLDVNYISPSLNWNTHNTPLSKEAIKVCKMHGSSNWLYCENCKALFYQVDKKLSLHKMVGLSNMDFRLFGEDLSENFHEGVYCEGEEEGKCKNCGNVLTSHIATFSYRKSFRTAAYPAIWYEAENLLATADHWVFIGYSLPEADFEFKHLIKSAELRNGSRHPGKIESVLYKDDFAGKKFQHFFGKENVIIYKEGLKDYVNQL